MTTTTEPTVSFRELLASGVDDATEPAIATGELRKIFEELDQLRKLRLEAAGWYLHDNVHTYVRLLADGTEQALRERIAAEIADIAESRARAAARSIGQQQVVDRVQADTYRTAAWLIRNPDQFRATNQNLPNHTTQETK